MGMVLVHHEIAGRAGVLVLGVLGQRPHIPAPLAVGHRVGPWDDEPLGNVRAGQRDFFRVAEHPHGLPPVHGGALHLRLRLEHRQLRAIGRVHGVGAHMVQRLPGLLCRLEIATGPFVVGLREPPGPGLPVHPAVGTAQIKQLPGLELDGLARLHAPDLDAAGEETDHPVGSGGVKDVRKLVRPLPPQVVQVPLAGQDLVLAALGPQLSLGHLLGVDAHRVVPPGLPSLAHVSLRRGRQSGPRPWPPPVSGPAAPGRRASGPACRRTGGYSAPAPGASRSTCPIWTPPPPVRPAS